MLLLAQPAAAYTLLRNNYPDAPVGCDNSVDYPCIEWPLSPSGLSSTTYVYLDPSLATITLVNMSQDALNAFTQWNGAPAKELFLVRATSVSQASGYSLGYPTVVYAYDLGDGIYGATFVYTKADIGAGSNHHTIVTCQTVMNTGVVWNHALDFHRQRVDPGVYLCWADSRKVVTRELGHGLCLGRTGHVAIMQRGATTFYKSTPDDFAGLRAAYGAS